MIDKLKYIGKFAAFPIFVTILAIILSNCDGFKQPENKPSYYNAESSSGGIVVHGYCVDGWIKNTNDFPVRVKNVWQFRGETTKWIHTFQPGEIKRQYISHQHGFYILTLDGIEIGWIEPKEMGSR